MRARVGSLYTVRKSSANTMAVLLGIVGGLALPFWPISISGRRVKCSINSVASSSARFFMFVFSVADFIKR